MFRPEPGSLGDEVLNLAVREGLTFRAKRGAWLMHVFAFGYMCARLSVSAYTEFMDRFTTHVGATVYCSKRLDNEADLVRIVAHELQHHRDMREMGALRYVWRYTSPECWGVVGGLVQAVCWGVVAAVFGWWWVAAAGAAGGLVCAVGWFYLARTWPSPGRMGLELRAYGVTGFVMVELEGYKSTRPPARMIALFDDASYLWMGAHAGDVVERELTRYFDLAHSGRLDVLAAELSVVGDLARILKRRGVIQS